MMLCGQTERVSWLSPHPTPKAEFRFSHFVYYKPIHCYLLLCWVACLQEGWMESRSHTSEVCQPLFHRTFEFPLAENMHICFLLAYHSEDICETFNYNLISRCQECIVCIEFWGKTEYLKFPLWEFSVKNLARGRSPCLLLSPPKHPYSPHKITTGNYFVVYERQCKISSCFKAVLLCMFTQK